MTNKLENAVILWTKNLHLILKRHPSFKWDLKINMCTQILGRDLLIEGKYNSSP